MCVVGLGVVGGVCPVNLGIEGLVTLLVLRIVCALDPGVLGILGGINLGANLGLLRKVELAISSVVLMA